MGNERADTLAKKGSASNSCRWTIATLTWAKYQPRQMLLRANYGTGRTPFHPTRGLPKNAAAIARMKHHHTAKDKRPLRPAPRCECDGRACSAMHNLVECPLQMSARSGLVARHCGPVNWTSITQDKSRQKALRQFMNKKYLIQVREVFTSNEDMRDADYN